MKNLKIKSLILGLVLLFSLVMPFISAEIIDQLADGSTIKTMIFNSSDSQIVYLNISKYFNINEAKINLT